MATHNFNTRAATWPLEGRIVFKLDDGATEPVRATPHSAGFDLVASADCVLNCGVFTPVSTGVHVQFPPGVYGQIHGRSGNALRNGIIVGGGVIDSDYTGEVKVLASIIGGDPVRVAAGTKIAQLVPIVYSGASSIVAEFSVNRPGGHVGFGSTGSNIASISANF